MTIWSGLELVIGAFCFACALPSRGVVRYASVLAGVAACADAFVYEDGTPWLSWTMDLAFYGSCAVILLVNRRRRRDQPAA